MPCPFRKRYAPIQRLTDAWTRKENKEAAKKKRIDKINERIKKRKKKKKRREEKRRWRAGRQSARCACLSGMEFDKDQAKKN